MGRQACIYVCMYVCMVGTYHGKATVVELLITVFKEGLLVIVLNDLQGVEPEL